MSGETEQNVSGWTVDTLHTHFAELFKLLREQLERQWQEERRATDKALDAHDEALRVARDNAKESIAAALAAVRESTTVQADTLKQYRATQNEWRESLNDVNQRSMPREEAKAAIDRATERIHELHLQQQGMVLRAEFETARAHDAQRINDQANRITQLEAGLRAAQATKSSIIAAVAVAVSLLGVLILAANSLLR